MRTFLIVLAGLGLFSLASTLAIYSYGLFAANAKGRRSQALPTADDETILDGIVSRAAHGRAGEHGLVMLSDNLDAFAARALSARDAGRSLDLMYYIWRGDLTGRLLVHELIKAADRGVRVRLLLDDVNAHGADDTYFALHTHPNIDVRLFNPSRARAGALLRGIEMALRAFSATRRMHNKAWIADGRLAIVGGRNIGDEYFDASRASNFIDQDVMLVGPGVRETEAIFDAFWNSDVVIPIDALASRGAIGLDGLRRSLAALVHGAVARPYIDRIRERTSAAWMTGAAPTVCWTREASIVSDPPEKALGRKRRNWLMEVLLPVIASARNTLEIVSPYFIPGEHGTAALVGQVKSGIDVAVLTNSLAATDVAAVHGAYAGYRKPLLEGGVRLFELQPFARRRFISPFGSSGASLHTKSFTVDGHIGFVGSFNFDPRSASLNTEMGILFAQAELVAEMRKLFSLETEMRASYSVTLRDGALHWQGEVDGKLRRFDRDPEAGFVRRLLAAIIGLLPIHSQL